MLAAIDAGFLTPTDIAFGGAGLRILFPGAPKYYCARYDLTDSKIREMVREQIMPAAVARREFVLSDQAKLEEIVNCYLKEMRTAERYAAHEKRAAIALSVLPSNEQEVFVYGVRLWPSTDAAFGSYDYDQLCAAVWYFHDIDGWLQGRRVSNDPRSRAVIARLSTKWLEAYIARAYRDEPKPKIQKVYQLVHLIARLLEDNPDGEWVIPPSPKVEGQW